MKSRADFVRLNRETLKDFKSQRHLYLECKGDCALENIDVKKLVIKKDGALSLTPTVIVNRLVPLVKQWFKFLKGDYVYCCRIIKETFLVLVFP